MVFCNKLGFNYFPSFETMFKNLQRPPASFDLDSYIKLKHYLSKQLETRFRKIIFIPNDLLDQRITERMIIIAKELNYEFMTKLKSINDYLQSIQDLLNDYSVFHSYNNGYKQVVQTRLSEITSIKKNEQDGSVYEIEILYPDAYKKEEIMNL
jgi:hypothetical protein